MSMNMDGLAFFSSNESSSKPANLHELLQYEDWRFVEAAYELLLARKPDQNGYGFYLTRIRNGARKLQILKEISKSPEASPQRKNIKGLRKALFMDSIGSLPVVGNIFRRLVSLEGDSKLEVRLRILEQKNSVVGDVVPAIVSQQTVVEARLNQVPQLVGDLSKQLTVMETRLNPVPQLVGDLSNRLTSLAKRSLLEKLNARDIQNLAQSVEDLRQRQSAVAQSVEDLRQRQSSFAQSAEDLGQRQSIFAQFVEDFGQRQSACTQSVEDLGQRQTAVETQLPALFQTLSDLNQRQLVSDNDRDNLTKSMPVALRKLAREVAEGHKKMTDLEALLESRYR